MYLFGGTIVCQLFDTLCEEDYSKENYSEILKHSECPQEGEVEFEPLLIEG